MRRQAIKQRGTMTGRVGNYAADVDTAGMDQEMIDLFQQGGAGHYTTSSKPTSTKPTTRSKPKPDAIEREVERRYKISNIHGKIAEKKAINKGYRILKGQ